jgi:hypothetical protein
MEFKVGDIIKGAGARAPQFKIVKVCPKMYRLMDAYGKTRMMRHNLPWHKVFLKPTAPKKLYRPDLSPSGPKGRKKHEAHASMAYNALNCPAVTALLQQVQSDYNLEDNLVVKYLGSPAPSMLPMPSFVTAPTAEVPKEKKKRVIKEKPKEAMCTAVTNKGPCKFAAKCDGLCGIHLRKRDGGGESSKAPKEPVVKKVAKKAEAPKHSHPLTEEAEECELCETHGNVVKPELSKAEFEAVAEDGKSLQDRLKAILANSDNDEPDEAEEPEEEEEEELTASLKAKLAKQLAEEDEDSEVDEESIEQMTETPPSRDRLADMMAKMKMKDEEEYDFEALEEEMED